MQDVLQMCSSFDANKSTKGASKLRRDLINGEIANLRDLLPLPSSTRQRLSQLQLMALVCVYVRKANYFQQVFKRAEHMYNTTPNIGFSKALSGFLIMMTQNGKLLYISDNAAEYLGHSMEDLLIHGDSVYDIIDKADHATVQAELLRSPPPGSQHQHTSTLQQLQAEEPRIFLCRMNVSRNARRQMRFGDQKVVLMQGHFLSYLPLCSRNEPVFVATCTPIAMPETRECVVQGATNVFTSIHAMDMKVINIDRNGEHYLGYSRAELAGISWYQLIHNNYIREAQSKHRLISQSEQEKSCILLLKVQTSSGGWVWSHTVLQVKDSEPAGQGQANQQQSVIVATNQVLSEREAAVMRANSWLYHYYTVQTKLQYGLAYPAGPGETHTTGIPGIPASPNTQQQAQQQQAAAAKYFAGYFPNAPLNYYQTPHLHNLGPDLSSGYPIPTPPSNGYSTSGGAYHYGKESPLDFSTSYSNYPGYFQYQNQSQVQANWHLPPQNNTTNHNQQHQLQQQQQQNSPQQVQVQVKTEPSRKRAKKSQTPSVVNNNNNNPESISSHLVSPARSSIGHPTLMSNGHGTGHSDSGQNHHGYHGSHHGNHHGNGPVTMTTPYYHHQNALRARTSYKIGLFEEDQAIISAATLKDQESLIALTSCPLTPSPIWEGQTQRVPDLSVYTPNQAYTDSAVFSTSGPDMVHCVPTYHPSFMIYTPPTPTSSTGSLEGHHQGQGNQGQLIGSTHYGQFPSKSPNNKENRLPPTPESSSCSPDGEVDEKIKWENL